MAGKEPFQKQGSLQRQQSLICVQGAAPTGWKVPSSEVTCLSGCGQGKVSCMSWTHASSFVGMSNRCCFSLSKPFWTSCEGPGEEEVATAGLRMVLKSYSDWIGWGPAAVSAGPGVTGDRSEEMVCSATSKKGAPVLSTGCSAPGPTGRKSVMLRPGEKGPAPSACPAPGSSTPSAADWRADGVDALGGLG